MKFHHIMNNMKRVHKKHKIIGIGTTP